MAIRLLATWTFVQIVRAITECGVRLQALFVPEILNHISKIVSMNLSSTRESSGAPVPRTKLCPVFAAVQDGQALFTIASLQKDVHHLMKDQCRPGRRVPALV